MDTLIEPRIEPQYHGERRAERRKRVLKGATITFNRGYGALQCVARNMTENGAMLAFGDTAGVPAIFDIQFAHEDETRKARIRWRKSEMVGVEFE
ncbi:MAG: PilZ domain-containing protein [Rhizobiaceae bacterium]